MDKDVNRMVKLVQYLPMFLIGVVMVGALAACGSRIETSEEAQKRMVDEKSDLDFYIYKVKYVKDPRTGLCFATYQLGWNMGLMTNVPCTDKVLELVKN